ncbi:MAG TPA: SRPBCC family protein [Rhizomicrobium sp.]
MKTGLFASAAIVLALLGAPVQAAEPHEWRTILLEKVVDRTPDRTWAKIGGYCAIQQWLKLQSCVVTSGNGVALGTNRRLNGKTDEIIVAQTPWSYTYAQQPSDVQPASPIFYHGTLAVEPLDRGRKTRIVYTLFYDVGALTPEQKGADIAARSKRFGEGLDIMKQMAEAQ